MLPGVAVTPGLSPQCMECAKYPSPRTWRGGVCAVRALGGRGRTIASTSTHTRCFSTKVLVASLLRAMVYVRSPTGTLAFHTLRASPRNVWSAPNTPLHERGEGECVQLVQWAGRSRSIRYSRTISRCWRLATRSLHLSPTSHEAHSFPLSTTMERGGFCAARTLGGRGRRTPTLATIVDCRAGHVRYWKRVFVLNGNPYLITKEWYANQREELVKWAGSKGMPLPTG